MEPNTSPLYGSIDVCNENYISGWAFNHNNPNETVELEIYIDNQLITSTIANIYRQDLLDSGIGNGKHAFKIPTPNQFIDGNVHKITIKNQSQEILRRDRKEIVATFQIQEQIQGNVDNFINGVFSGWAIRNRRLFAQVDMLANDTLVATALATNFRQDLANKNINAGYAAFNIKVPCQLKTQAAINIKIQIGTNILYTKQHKFAPIKVLIVSESNILNDPSHYYRCEHLRLLLSHAQMDTQLISIYEFSAKEYLGYDSIIFVRCQADAAVFQKIEWFKTKFKTRIIYGIDDLIFLPWHTHDSGAVRSEIIQVDEPNMQIVYNRLRLLTLADGAITTTTTLYKYLNAMSIPTQIIPNMIRQHDLTDRTFRQKNMFELLCMAGTPTHYRDMQEIEMVLEKFLLKYHNKVKLTLLGLFRDDLTLLRLPNVIHIPLVPYQKMLQIIETHDLCLVPLEITEFNNAKSCLKYIECGAKAVPVITSAVADYQRVIQHGVNGLIAQDLFLWLSLLEWAIHNPIQVFNMGNAAQKDVAENYCIETYKFQLQDFIGA